MTGSKTEFSEDLQNSLASCRRATSLPLGVGFGVKESADVRFLKRKADIAVIGSQLIRIFEEKGIKQMGDFLRGLIG